MHMLQLVFTTIFDVNCLITGKMANPQVPVGEFIPSVCGDQLQQNSLVVPHNYIALISSNFIENIIISTTLSVLTFLFLSILIVSSDSRPVGGKSSSGCLPSVPSDGIH